MEQAGNLQWAVIINPHAGGKKAFLYWQELAVVLHENKVACTPIFTEGAFHAVQLAKKCRHAGYQKFLIIGGDGTISEVIHGIFSSSVPTNERLIVGLIPIGTGNDWARYWHISPDIPSVLKMIQQEKTTRVDIGKVSSICYDGLLQNRFFINALGEGFDAKVAQVTTFLGAIFKGKSWLYSLSVFIVPFVYRSKQIKIEFDNGLLIDKKIYTLSCGNGCYTGGGIKQTPNAMPTDGKFDVMMVDSPSLWGIITAIQHLFKGKLLQHKLVTSTQTKRYVISSDFPLCIETDGISLPQTNRAEVTILPQALQFLVP